jgi:hypothetical protein
LRVGVPGGVEDDVDRPLLHYPAGVHHVDVVADLRHHSQVVRYQHQAHPSLALQPFEQPQNLGLDGDVERCGRLVGDDHLRLTGEGGGYAYSLALTSGKLVRVAARGLRGQTDHGEQFGDAPRSVDGQTMGLELLLDLSTHSEHWIEVGGRVLKDHRDLPAAHRTHLPVTQPGEIPAREQDLTGHHSSGAGGEQAHDGERRHRLAAAALSHDRGHLALPDLQGNAVDGPHLTTHAADLGDEALQLQYSFAAHAIIPPSTGDRWPR